MAGRRLDTHLETEVAEFLVCGRLMIEGIPSYKAYTNTAGYDILAGQPTNGPIARIQVKSRWASGSGKSFMLKNRDADFVVFVALNRGKRKNGEIVEGSRGEPEYFVFPIDTVLAARRDDGWKKVSLSKIGRLGEYRNNWALIFDFLKLDRA